MMNPNSVNTIVERAEQFTRDNLHELAKELQGVSTGNNIDENGKLKELFSKLLLTGGATQLVTMQLAIAMVSNECVKFIAEARNDAAGDNEAKRAIAARNAWLEAHPGDAVGAMKAALSSTPPPTGEAVAWVQRDALQEAMACAKAERPTVVSISAWNDPGRLRYDAVPLYTHPADQNEPTNGS